MAETKSNQTSVMLPGDASGSCWSCGSMRAAHFCNSCGKVQPAVPVDYFTFFGLPRKLNLDLRALEKEFYLLSRKLHPDLFSRADPQEQQWSLEKSSLLNDAYRTLKDPILRTEYLLKLEGIPLEEQSKQATEQARSGGRVKKQVAPPELLEEVFELNLQLEELRLTRQAGGTDPDLVRELEKQKKHLEAMLRDIDEELQQRWKNWDGLIEREESGKAVSPQERARVCDQMLDVLNRRTYVRNLVRDVREAVEGSN
jgi:molecular chaperone HscB